MKRKLNEGNVPTPTASEKLEIKRTPTFEGFTIDTRLLQAIAKEQFETPTPVQQQAIPLALEGKDILARAETGSGKTAAYVLPILETILRKKERIPDWRGTSALILVPTRELAEQVSKVFTNFSIFCAKTIRITNLTQKTSDAVQRSLLAESPDVVIATPARALLNISTSALSLDNIAHLVLDEADLVLSYGYEEDLQNIANAVPSGVQTFMMSATLSKDIDILKGLFCRNPVVLELGETVKADGGVSQYVVKCAEDEKFLLIYVIFKLKLIKGKCIIFVGDIDRCYRLKLYLEQFGIKSCVLNPELPVNSRIHVIEEFNKNVYDIIVASDEHEVVGLGLKNASKIDDAGGQNADVEASAKILDHSIEEEGSKGLEHAAQVTKKKRKVSKKQNEYGVSRGIDFKNIACVLNFDLPMTSESYTHRIGRTARAGKSGMALSFAVPKALFRKHKPTSFPTAEHDEEVLNQITTYQAKKGRQVLPYTFDMTQVDAFRYRMTDALRAVTRLAVREARTRELRRELLNSEKLKRHFEENPKDLHHLRHDGELRPARVQPHLRHVPDYLLPGGGKGSVAKTGEIGFVGAGKTNEHRVRNARSKSRMKGKGKKVGGFGRKADPLRTFNAKGRK